jgi:hypothetical protein
MQDAAPVSVSRAYVLEELGRCHHGHQYKTLKRPGCEEQCWVTEFEPLQVDYAADEARRASSRVLENPLQIVGCSEMNTVPLKTATGFRIQTMTDSLFLQGTCDKEF